MKLKIYPFPSPFVTELCGSSLSALAYGLNNFDKLLKISSGIPLGDVWERERHLDSCYIFPCILKWIVLISFLLMFSWFLKNQRSWGFAVCIREESFHNIDWVRKSSEFFHLIASAHDEEKTQRFPQLTAFIWDDYYVQLCIVQFCTHQYSALVICYWKSTVLILTYSCFDFSFNKKLNNWSCIFEI